MRLVVPTVGEQLCSTSTVADNAGVHELLRECAHIQLQIVHDLTFSQQGVYFPACFRASSSCNMWDQSVEKWKSGQLFI
jgi:hypothetical protein